ncbi:MAG: pyridoxal phosphate-dependent aminotransferase [Zetaproteobacteria bacterium]|nr:pyridoxal phosphate-dependent aminotransferase [Zetaproteobacteria bacterium]
MAKQLRAEGKDVLSFALGEPDFSAPAVVVNQAIESLRAGRQKYGPAGGGLEIRQAICAKLQRDNNLEYAPEQIVCGIGAKEILFHVFLSMLNPGDEVLIPAPYWVSYGDQIKACGAKPVIVPFTEDPLQPCYRAEMLEKYATERTVAIVLCSPNNPAGMVIDPQEMVALGEFLLRKDWWVISDEIYEYMTFGAEHLSIVNVAPQLKSRTVIINGLSKGFAMTGWRVGYCAAPQQMASYVKTLQSHSSTCIPPFIEDAAVIALNGGKDLMADQLLLLEERSKLALQLVRELHGVHVMEPKGAFYLFLDLRDRLQSSSFADRLASMPFCERLLKEEYVAAVPGDAFGCPGFLRLSYATDEDTIRAGIQRIARLLDRI